MSSNAYGALSVFICLAGAAGVSAEMGVDACYGSGDVAGAVVGTFISTLALVAGAMFVYKWYWRSRKGKHLVLMTDAENPNDQFAFDNPCFREATPVKHGIQEGKNVSKLEKNRWLGWSPLHTFVGHKNEKLTSLDDSYVNDSHLKVVSLKGHDFTGLGFNICGNMRDGIFVKDVLHRGPAFESGCINSGDRIDSVCISFRNMVFEDALTILSYASPYEVQVQVENDSHSRPSTLIRSKRESNVISSAERIRHPKYNRSQSISHLAEIGKSNNKWYNQQAIGYTTEKNRINLSLNKSDIYSGNQNDYPTLKISAVNDPKKESNKLVKSMGSPKNVQNLSNARDKKQMDAQNPFREDGRTTQSCETTEENKMQKFGIKVLPININPKMGIQSVTGGKKTKINSQDSDESTLNKNVETVGGRSEEKWNKEQTNFDEVDGNKENVKALISKGLHNLKEKISQNSLGKKKTKELNDEVSPIKEAKNENRINEPVSFTAGTGRQSFPGEEEKSPHNVPIPKARSSVLNSNIAIEQTSQLYSDVPEEVARAGDVARNNRKSIIDPQEGSVKSSAEGNVEEDVKTFKSQNVIQKIEDNSGSDSSSEGGSTSATGGTKRPKKSKGKAPAPPQTSSRDSKFMLTSEEINAITNEDFLRDETNIFEPTETQAHSTVDGNSLDNIIMKKDRHFIEAYDSDSDSDTKDHSLTNKRNGTKIELSATQVTIHHSPTSDASNDEEIETSRKAASLGDLSKIDPENTLTVVLERAVSLDLADGTTQCGKKRKAPLPPPEEFPAVFDEIGYRKEPRLENSLGLNTFQRRLKKSSDFGTLEDALQDGPKSLEIEVKKPATPLDVIEANHSNIQEFSSWLAECRKQKDADDLPVRASSTSLVNVTMDDAEATGEDYQCDYPIQSNNVTFSVNGRNIQDFESDDNLPQESSSANSYTMLVISQPNSLEPVISEGVTMNLLGDKSEPSDTTTNDMDLTSSEPSEMEFRKFNVSPSSERDVNPVNEEIPPMLPTSPIPIMSKTTVSSPLSKGLTYVTEIKVSTSDEETVRSDPIPDETNDENIILSITSDSAEDKSTEDIPEIEAPSSGPNSNIEPSTDSLNDVSSFSSLVRKFSSEDSANEVTVNNESILCESARKGNDYGYETSKIPIRTMKSETGQKVLATIQSLAAKESLPKNSEIEYAKKVASLFSSPGSNVKGFGPLQAKSENESSGFYLTTGSSKKPGESRKIPPVVPPRKIDASLADVKSTVTVAVTGKGSSTKEKVTHGDFPTDRNIVTFSSFMPNTTSERQQSTPKIVNWKQNSKEIGDINGSHMQMQTAVVSLPVKTSATKIVFENKDFDNEEL